MSDGQVKIGVSLDDSGLGGDLNALKNKLMKSGAMLTGLLGGVVTSAVVGIGNAALDSASKIEDMVAAFTPLTGGAQNAKDMIAALNKEAATTPFNLEDIGATAKQLLPVLGNDVEAVTKTFRMLGDTAGGNAQKLDSITRGYAKVMNTGKVSMEALNMISDAGVPIQSQLAKSMGISVEKMYDLSSQGKITAADLTKTFQTMTKEGGLFFDGMNVASRTFSGKVSTMQDNLSQAAAVIGNMLLPAAKATVTAISDMAGGFVAFANTLDETANRFRKFASDTRVTEEDLDRFVGSANRAEFAMSKLVGRGATADRFKQMAQQLGLTADEMAQVALESSKVSPEVKKIAEGFIDQKRVAADLAKLQADTWAKMDERQKKIADAGRAAREAEAKLAAEALERQTTEDGIKGAYASQVGLIQTLITSARTLKDLESGREAEKETADAKESTARQIVLGYQNAAIANMIKAKENEEGYQKSLGKTVDYTGAMVAGLQVSSHLLQKMGTDDAKALAEALNSVSTIAANIGLAATGNPAAIASVAIAGIDLIANAWDQLWGKQSRAQKAANDAAKKAEEERIAAVHRIDEEYQAKFDSDLERLEKERDERVAYARSIGADVLNIERYYAGEIAKVRTKSSGTLLEEAEIATESERIYAEYYAKAIVMADEFNAKYAGVVRTTPEEILANWGLGDEMRVALESVETSLIMYKARYSQSFEGIGSAISNGLKNGLDEFDIKDSIMEMLKNMAIDQQMLLLLDDYKEFGKQVAEAMKDGLTSQEVIDLRKISDAIVVDAEGKMTDINKLFGTLGGDLASGLVLDVAGATNVSQQVISLTATGVLNVDGQTLGTVVFKNFDQTMAGAYGA